MATVVDPNLPLFFVTLDILLNKQSTNQLECTGAQEFQEREVKF